MQYRVSFDSRKCAKNNIESEIFGFWDRGDGNKFVEKKILLPISIGDSFILNENINNRNLMQEFNVTHFIVKNIQDRCSPFNVMYKQIVLEPIFKS